MVDSWSSRSRTFFCFVILLFVISSCRSSSLVELESICISSSCSALLWLSSSLYFVSSSVFCRYEFFKAFNFSCSVNSLTFPSNSCSFSCNIALCSLMILKFSFDLTTSFSLVSSASLISAYFVASSSIRWSKSWTFSSDSWNRSVIISYSRFKFASSVLDAFNFFPSLSSSFRVSSWALVISVVSCLNSFVWFWLFSNSNFVSTTTLRRPLFVTVSLFKASVYVLVSLDFSWFDCFISLWLVSSSNFISTISFWSVSVFASFSSISWRRSLTTAVIVSIWALCCSICSSDSRVFSRSKVRAVSDLINSSSFTSRSDNKSLESALSLLIRCSHRPASSTRFIDSSCINSSFASDSAITSLHDSSKDSACDLLYESLFFRSTISERNLSSDVNFFFSSNSYRLFCSCNLPLWLFSTINRWCSDSCSFSSSSSFSALSKFCSSICSDKTVSLNTDFWSSRAFSNFVSRPVTNDRFSDARISYRFRSSSSFNLTLFDCILNCSDAACNVSCFISKSSNRSWRESTSRCKVAAVATSFVLPPPLPPSAFTTPVICTMMTHINSFIRSRYSIGTAIILLMVEIVIWLLVNMMCYDMLNS